MWSTCRWAAIVSLCSTLCTAAPPPARDSAAHSEESCDAFTWDLSREFSALKSPATLLAASADSRVNPVRLEEGRHFTTTLLPQGSVAFAAPPTRQRISENPTAGLLFFRTSQAGRFRVSLSSRHWIDVLDGGKVIDPGAHQGHGGCEALRTAVEFELPAHRELVLQLSGDGAATVDVVVTRIGKQ